MASLLFSLSITNPKISNHKKLTIVTFHRILPPSLHNKYPLKEIAVTTSELRWTLSLLTKHFICGTLQNMCDKFFSGVNSDKPYLAITFDDGQLDNLLYGVPILSEFGLNATFFITSEMGSKDHQLLWHDKVAFCLDKIIAEGKAGKVSRKLSDLLNTQVEASNISTVVSLLKNISTQKRQEIVKYLFNTSNFKISAPWQRILNEAEILSLCKKGHEIGSHSHSHEILTPLPDEMRNKEISESRNELTNLVGKEIVSICYPNGNWNSKVIKDVKDAGFKYGVTTNRGLNDRNTCLHTLKRCCIQSETSVSSRNILSKQRFLWRISGLHPFLR